MHNARIVYEKVLVGDPIASEELEPALKFFKNLETDLRILGLTFQLAANEAGRVYRLLEDFSSSRKRPAKPFEADAGVVLDGNAIFLS